MRKASKLVRNVLILPLAVLASLLVLLSGGNAVLTAVERSTHKAPGTLVEVNGKKVHVFTSGQRGPNVVLLSGLGTLSPVIDFAPLIRELQVRARVTVVEYPGYGWSDDTEEPRSTEASVDETRQALRLAGLTPPYVLVAHSISGLQALVWTHFYPSEVSAVVGLDSTLPAQLPFMFTMPQAGNTAELLRASGIVRLALLLDPSLSGARGGELSPDEVREFGMITNWNLGNHAIAHETGQVLENLKSAQGLSFPASLPVTFVLASQGVAKDAPGIPGGVWLSEHQRLVKGNPNGKVVVLEGDHYIHHGNAKAVAALVFEVLDKVKE